MPLAQLLSLVGARPSFVGALLALTGLSVFLSAVATLPPAQTAAALLIVWLGAIPGLVYLQGRIVPAVPLLPFAGLYYICFFGLPAFAAPLAYQMGGKTIMYLHVVLGLIEVEVLLLIAAGVVSMWCGYYAARATLFARLAPLRLPQATAPVHLTFLYLGLLAASLAYRHVEVLRSIPSIGQFLDPVGYLALGGIFLQWRAGHLASRWALLIVMIAAPLEIYWRLRFALLTDILMLAMFFGFLLWRERYFKTIGILAIIGAGLVSLYGAAGPVRIYATSFLDQSIKISQSLSDILQDEGRSEFVAPNGLTISLDRRFSPIVNRVAQVWIFQGVYERSPDPVPYWGGTTYVPLLTSYVPRLIYPDKPAERAGGDFGHRYGFLPPENDNTSVNIPWIVELLANFGPAGVLIGMAVFGLFLSFMDGLFNARDMGDLEFLIGLTMIFRLGYQESNFSVMTGSLLPLFVCLYIYFRFGPALMRHACAIGRRAPMHDKVD